MEKILTQTATSPMKLEHFLREAMGLTKKQISQAKFREQGILVNGIKSRVSCQVRAGDAVQVILEEEDCSSHLQPLDMNLEILYEDEDVLAVNKPAGIVVHPSHGHYQDSLANAVQGMFEKRGQQIRVRAVGRLDKETSGIVIFAKSQAAAARLDKQKKEGIFQKTYLAIAQGIFAEKTGTIRARIAPKEGSLMRMCVADHGKEAVTHYRVLEEYGPGARRPDGRKPGTGTEQSASLVELTLETGRTHQIRVHMAHMGHPLVGDRIYNDRIYNDRICNVRSLIQNPSIFSHESIEKDMRVPDSQGEAEGGAALHAWKCVFRQPFSDEVIGIEADPSRLLTSCSVM